VTRPHPHRRLLVPAGLALGLALAAACGPRSKPADTGPPVLPSTVHIGACADPAADGVVGDNPQMERADRDLDGDRVDEIVVADRSICTGDGNCHWNLFSREDDTGCHRYLGTVAGAKIQRVPIRGEDGFVGLRSWWMLTADGRFLMQEHRFRHGGYQIVEAVLCRQADDDRLECATR
jgi:hypothetical protein